MSELHCFIVRLETELDEAVAEHREYLQDCQTWQVKKQRVISLAEAARDLIRRGLRKERKRAARQMTEVQQKLF